TSEKLDKITSALSPIIKLAHAAPEKLTVDNINSIDEVLKQHGGLSVSGAVKGDLKELREDFFPELRRLFFEKEAAGVGLGLRKFLLELAEKYEEEKRSRSALDFSDLTEKAIQLLRTAPHVRLELREKFKYILVDEFQDTNRLQKTLVDLLRSPGNLFVVGDARQSIYGFRDADLEVFLKYREEVAEESGAVIRMDENFRTRPEIIDFVNHVFMGIPRGKAPVGYSKLIAASRFGEKRDPSVELVLSKGANMDEARRLEAIALARRIQDIVENEEVKITRLGGPREGSPISYGDIAVLLRTTADIKLYERALAELNIPFLVVRGRGLYNAREITDLVNFLKVIDNPLDEIKLAAVLRSPFVGVSDECLFWLAHYSKDKNGDGKEIFYTLSHADEIPEIEPHHRDRLLRFAEQLGLLRDLKGRLPISAFMDAVIDKTGFDTRILALPSGRQKYANIRKIVELTRGFLEKRGFSGLGAFFRAISDLRVMEMREPEAPIDVERNDVLKLMTIHSAKGLEFPVVALADLSRDRRNRTGDLTFSKKTGLGFRTFNPVTRGPEMTRSCYQIDEEQGQKDMEEMERVFYVALTRAEEHLLLSGALGSRNKGGWLKALAENLDLSLESEDMPESITFGGHGCKLRVITDGIQRKTHQSFKKLPALDRQKVLDGEKLGLPPGSPQSAKNILSSLKAVPDSVRRGEGNYVYSATEIMAFLL
ncbi:MAG: UvrD-helicase domain-containing protein, partial [Candidatus Brocadiales bacterium]